jgi:hypothetical protein
MNKFLASRWDISKEVTHRIADHEVLIRIETIGFLHVGYVGSTKGSSVGNGVSGDGTSETNNSAHVDEGRLVCRCSGAVERIDYTTDIEASVFDIDNMPSTGAHLAIDILGVGEVDTSIASDLVVVVDDGEVVQFQVACERNRLQRNTFL